MHHQLRICISLVLLTTITRVSNAQNVGIGTTNPQTKLDVNGSFRLKNGTEGSGKILRSDTSGVASWGKLRPQDVMDTGSIANFSCMTETGVDSTGANFGSRVSCITGNYAYVANTMPDLFTIYNISNPASPYVVNSAVFLNNTVNDITATGNYLYIAVQNSNGLLIYDITNPAAPVLLPNTLPISSPISIKLAGNYAYIRTAGIFYIVDVSNPASPFIRGSVATYTGTALTNRQSIALSGNFAYVVSNILNGFQIIDISNPDAPFVASQISEPNFLGVMVSGSYLYATQGTAKLRIFNINNPSSPLPVQTVSIAGNSISFGTEGDYVFLLVTSQNSIYVYNIGNPAATVLAKTFPVYVGSQSLTIRDNNAYYISQSIPVRLRILKLSCNQTFSYNVSGNLIAIPDNWERTDTNLVNLNQGNVGIGTSDPKQKLDVNGTIRATAIQLPTGAGAGKFLKSDASGNASWGTELDPQVNTTLLNSVPRWNGSALISGTLYDNGTFIGIGNTSPTKTLDVTGTTRTINFQMTTGAGAGKILQSDASGNASWVSSLTLPVTESDPKTGTLTGNKIPKWGTTTLVDGMLTDNGLSVGVGVTNPVNKMDISGSVVIGSSYAGVETAPANGLWIEGNTGIGSFITPNNKLEVAGGVLIGANLLGNTLAPLNGLSVEGNVGIGLLSPQAKLHVSGTAVITGNTGIGTLSPQSKLHIVNAAVAGADYYTNGRLIVENNGQNYVQLMNNAASSSGIISGTDLSIWRSGISFNADSSVSISSGGASARLIVDNTGFIGVNQQNPASFFDVTGSVGTQITSGTVSKTLTASDHTHIILTTASAVTITLPAASTCARRMYIVINHNAAAKTISQYVNLSGATVTAIPASASLILQSDGILWYQLK